MTLYICTVGTSIAGRFAPEVPLARRIADNLASKRARHGDDIAAFLIDATAETNVLARRDCGPADEVLLLASDTEDGRACAEALAELIHAELGAAVRVEPIAGLQVVQESRFREEGLRNLIRKTRAAVRDAASRGVPSVFNVTGGYKGVVPYLTLLGMFERADILYVYKEIDALIRLPALPVRMASEEVAAALPMLAMLAERGLMEEAAFDRLARRQGWAGDPVLDLFFERHDGMVAVSAAGELALEAPAPTPRAGRLFVHPKARRRWRASLAAAAVPRLNVPALRRPERHRDTHRNTDLLIWKTHGPSAPRLFYWTEGDDVWLADILSHDEYDRTVLVGPGVWREDYAADRFEAVDLDASEPTEPPGAALAAFVDAVEADAAEAADLRAGLEAARSRADRLERRREEAQAALAALASDLVAEAAAFATAAHAGQTRKDGVTPYVQHLREVARILSVEAGVGDPEVLAAGWLHDTIEDQPVSAETLGARFGARVRRLVEAVTDDKSLPKETRKALQVEHAPAVPADAALIKLADKTSNLRDLIAAPPAGWSDARRREYLDWARRVVAGLSGRGSPAHQRLEAAFAQAADRAEAALGHATAADI